MWCIGELNEEYRQRMYDLLELYARALSRAEALICIDEKSVQLTSHSRNPLPMAARNRAQQDYGYQRHGTSNLFVAVEPRAGRRMVSVTGRRGKIDFVAFVKELLTRSYAKARRVHLVLDNLNTHWRKCFELEFEAWQQARNAPQRTIEWKFTRLNVDQQLGRHYVL